MSTDPKIPSLSKDDASRLLAEGRVLLKGGDHNGALAIAERVLREAEETPEALLFAGEVHFSRANFVMSESLGRQCMLHFPDDHSGPVLRCRALLAMGRLGEARDIALGMADKDITDDTLIGILVMVLSGCMLPEKAYPLCKRAVENDPYNPEAHRRLALTCRLVGKLDEGVAAANIALRFNPHDYEMIGLRSAISTATRDKNHIAELQALLAAGCRNALGGARVAYALAKECEEIGEHKNAFAFLEAGAKFKRQTIKYDVRTELDTFRQLRRIFTAEVVGDTSRGFDTDEPIFILGLPRTGSSLVERIIASHSAVFAAGELRHFTGALMEEVRKLGKFSTQSELMQRTLETDPGVVGKRYVQRTRPFTGHTPHFTDKLPHNFVSIGLINRALPKAKIVHLRRSPMDACYAAYKFLFNEAYAWSYDLDEIAQYYAGYRDVMDHWRTVLPGRIIDVAYEDVVEDLEGEAKRLIASLGLDWEPACLAFHESEAATMTGSAAQVRKKIYASSVGRWRDYEEQLKPLADKLEAAGIDPYTP